MHPRHTRTSPPQSGRPIHVSESRPAPEMNAVKGAGARAEPLSSTGTLTSLKVPRNGQRNAGLQATNTPGGAHDCHAAETNSASAGSKPNSHT